MHVIRCPLFLLILIGVAVIGLAYTADPPDAAAQDNRAAVVDQVARTSLELVSLAYGFESVCGFPSEKDHDLLMRYFQSDYARQHKLVTPPPVSAFIAAMASRNPSVCGQFRAKIDEGAEAGRKMLEKLIAQSRTKNH